MHRLACTMTRRESLRYLAASATTLAVTGCVSDSCDGPMPIGKPVADMHCHVFNAADLPTDGFVRRVVFENYERQVCPAIASAFDILLEGLARLVVAILRAGAPTAREELARLESSVLTEEAGATQAEEIAIVRQAIADVLGESPFEVDNSEDRRIREALLEALLNEIGQPVSADSKASSQELAAAIYLSPGEIGRSIRWALLLIRSRRHIVSSLTTLYPDARLLTPALVDFSHWLDDPEDVDLEGQMLVMDQLQRRMNLPAMHGFMAFDPWRQIDEKSRGVSSSFDRVRSAIGTHGFIGVKLYPPMGFKPALNHDPGNPDGPLCFPERAFEAFPNFRRDIDHALAELLDWCDDQGVPVLAHATNSNGSNSGFSSRANPKFWRPALEDRKTLRLALAHFGGFDESTAGGDETWESEFGGLIASGEFPNVYADLSYLSELLLEDGATPVRERIRRQLGNFVNEFPGAVDRLLYGSDWIMLGREPRPGSLVREIADLLGSVGLTESQIAGVMGRNAVGYLGLEQGGASRERIAGYRQMHGLTMEAIDSLTA